MIDQSIPAEVITFREGLPGFETHHQYRLMSSPASEPFAIVQGVEPEGPSFVAIDPRRVFEGYGVMLDQAEETRLGASGRDSLLVLAIVTLHENGRATANLRAPLVINPASMRGIQVVAVESPYRIDHPLRAA